MQYVNALEAVTDKIIEHRPPDTSSELAMQKPKKGFTNQLIEITKQSNKLQTRLNSFASPCIRTRSRS